ELGGVGDPEIDGPLGVRDLVRLLHVDTEEPELFRQVLRYRPAEERREGKVRDDVERRRYHRDRGLHLPAPGGIEVDAEQQERHEHVGRYEAHKTQGHESEISSRRSAQLDQRLGQEIDTGYRAVRRDTEAQYRFLVTRLLQRYRSVVDDFQRRIDLVQPHADVHG